MCTKCFAPNLSERGFSGVERLWNMQPSRYGLIKTLLAWKVPIKMFGLAVQVANKNAEEKCFGIYGHWRADSLSFMVLTALVFAEDISCPGLKTRRVASNHRDQLQADFAPPMLDHVRHFGVAQKMKHPGKQFWKRARIFGGRSHLLDPGFFGFCF